MDILVRKIQRKGDVIVFKPNSKSGYRFTEDYAQPNLTPFQKSCIQVKAQKDRKLGSFWTPNFCYLGMLLVEHGEVSLADIIKGINVAPTDVFNKHFPEKKWYWYNKTDEQNLAVQTYFMGVRAVGSLLAYYYELQKTSKLKEADILYRQYLKPLGVAKILSQVDSNLACSDDNVYLMNLTSDDCLIMSADIHPKVKNKPMIASEAKRVKQAIDSGSKKESSKDENLDSGQQSKPLELSSKRLDIPKITKQQKEDSEDLAVVTTERSKKNPHIIPKIGEV